MYTAVQGDLAEDMGLIADTNGVPEDISDATEIKLHWVQPDGTTSDVDLVPDTNGLTVGAVKRTWVTGDTDVAGYHRGRITMKRGNGKQETFPSGGAWIYWLVSSSAPGD
jgi:hypothetical protein